MRRKRPVLIAILSTVIVTMVVVVWWNSVSADHVNKVRRLHGQTVKAVVSELGEPTEWDEFSMSSCCAGAFRIELQNFYPPKDPASANVRILEYIWHYNNHNVAAWFQAQNGTWVVLDTCRWDKGVEF